MKMDKEDEVIDKLYQQRKASIIAPNIILKAPEVFEQTYKDEKSFSPAKFLVILLGGGLASFGILAVMSHLANSPLPAVKVEPTLIKRSSVEYKHDDLSELTEQAVEIEIAKITQQPPTLPEILIRDQTLLKAKIVDDSTVKYSLDEQSLLLTIKQPELAIEVAHKVMPDYPRAAWVKQHTGFVTLSYQVLKSGTVDKIKIVNSSHYDLFEKSAIDALSQWQYLSNEQNNKTYQITFEFVKP